MIIPAIFSKFNNCRIDALLHDFERVHPMRNSIDQKLHRSKVRLTKSSIDRTDPAGRGAGIGGSRGGLRRGLLVDAALIVGVLSL